MRGKPNNGTLCWRFGQLLKSTVSTSLPLTLIEQNTDETLLHIDDQLHKHIFFSHCLKPDSYDLKFFREWLEGDKMGNFPLRGPDRNAWSENYESDLIAIRRRETGDPFSKWLINTIVPIFHQVVGHRIRVGDSLSWPAPTRSSPNMTSIWPCIHKTETFGIGARVWDHSILWRAPFLHRFGHQHRPCLLDPNILYHCPLLCLEHARSFRDLGCIHGLFCSVLEPSHTGEEGWDIYGYLCVSFLSSSQWWRVILLVNLLILEYDTVFWLYLSSLWVEAMVRLGDTASCIVYCNPTLKY